MAKVTDGIVLAGGFTVDLVTAAITVIVNSWSIDRAGSSIFQTDENDEPNAAVHYDGPTTGSANIQISTTGGQADIRGDTFITTAITGSSQTFNIVTSAISGSKSGLVTADITFALDINA